MKNRSFVPLLLGAVIILTSMSECRERWEYNWVYNHYEHSSVGLKLDGVPYMSTDSEEKRYGSGKARTMSFTYDGPFYYGEENEFYFQLYRSVSSADSSSMFCELLLCFDAAPELDRKYELGPRGEGNFGNIGYFSGGERYDFYSTGGYVMFTGLDDWDLDEEYGKQSFSGIFEFSAYDAKHDSTVVVTGGRFMRKD